MAGGDLAPAVEVARLLRDRYCGGHGLLARTVDVRRGCIRDPSPIIDELGDYVQYVHELGLITGDGALCEWARGQVLEALRLAQAPSGLIHGLALVHGLRGRTHRILYSNLASVDTLWGLAESLRTWGKGVISSEVERFLAGVRLLAAGRSGLPVYAVLPCRPLRLHLPLGSSMLAGAWIEGLVKIYDITGDPALLSWAAEMAQAVLALPEVRAQGLLPVRFPTSALGDLVVPMLDLAFRARGRPGSGDSVIAKGDAFFVFGLLALHRAGGHEWIRSAVMRWKRCALDAMTAQDGRFYDVRSARGATRDLSLFANNTWMELLLDIFHDMGDEECLLAARRSARAWLRRRTTAGLIPNRDADRNAALDPLVDLAVNLIKIEQLTEDREWGEEAALLSTALERHYRQPYGLAWEVDALTGEAAVTEISTKYLGLYLKLRLLNHHVRAQGARIFADTHLRSLATDR
ncbi:MAG: hypothetical protein RDU83_08295 [bacterium]|nr:hypothetical protein [bacterium]